MESSDLATQVARQLNLLKLRVVFAESCTAGWVSAILSSVPGISDHLCGSLVTYREASKRAWLGVSGDLLAEHSAVSLAVTEQMAVGALHRTEEADLAVAVTGHVGPNAPAALDGVCFIALVERTTTPTAKTPVEKHWQVSLREKARVDRQREAAHAVLDCLLEHLLASWR